jgi:hypothetical protein
MSKSWECRARHILLHPPRCAPSRAARLASVNGMRLRCCIYCVKHSSLASVHARHIDLHRLSHGLLDMDAMIVGHLALEE